LKKEKQKDNVTLSLFPKGNKGMLGNIIGAFVAIFVGVMLVGTISQEVNNVINCNMTNLTMNISDAGQPIGPTDSFGGGGSGQFGGYDGKVHKSWSSNLAPIKTNESFLDPECKFSEATKGILAFIPIFFAIAILAVGVSIAYRSIKDVGVV